jgi:membrane protein required for colicin V production
MLVVLALAAGLTAVPREPFWREAKLAPPLETAAIAVKPYLPAALADRVRYER